MSVLLSNNYQTTLTAGINNSTTTIPVASVIGLPSIGAGATCYLTIQQGSTIEIVLATSVSSLNITATRAQQGTAAGTFTSGAVVALRVTKGNFTPQAIIDGQSISTATVAADDKVIIQDTSTNNAIKTVTPQAIRDLDPTNPLAETKGGTNQSTYTTGDLLYASGSNTLSKRAIGNTGQRLQIASGVPTWKGGPTAFRAYRATNQSILNATSTKILYASETFDAGGYFDSTTNSRFTPLIAGKYFIYVNVVYNNELPAGTLVVVDLAKNGGAISENFGYSVPSTNGYYAIVIADMVDMNGTTDYLEVFTIQVAGSAKNLLGGSLYNFFSGILMEPA